MKKIKNLLAVLSSITVLTGTVGMTAFANNATKISKSEMEQVNQALEKYPYWSNSETEEAKNVYKSYIIDGFIIDEYGMVEDFNSLISNNTRIFAECESQLVTLIEKDGKLQAMGGMFLKKGEELVNFENEAEKIRKQEKEEITEMKFAISYILHLDMIYYRTKSGEFVVPYFDGDFVSSTIENGKIYTADEFVGRLNCVLNLSNYNPNSNGGVSFRETPLEYTGNNFIPIGDANIDYNVDVRDCSYIAQMLASNQNYMLKKICDYNKDGTINIRDAASLANSLTKR